MAFGLLCLLLADCSFLSGSSRDVEDAVGAGPSAGTEKLVFGRGGNRLIATDGTALPLHAWLPAGEPRAIVLALHGFNDYSGAFEVPATIFARSGIATFAYDQRGFGAAPDRGHWAGESALVDDAIEAARLLRRRYPARPLFLLGESMGGAVAILAATEERAAPRQQKEAAGIDGVILIAPAVGGCRTMRLLNCLGLRLTAVLMPSLQMSRDDISLLDAVRPSDSDAVIDAQTADPLVIKEPRIDAIAGMVDLMAGAQAAVQRLDLPALVLYGMKDRVIPRRQMARMVASLPNTATDWQRVAIYPTGYHLLLRDRNGPVVIKDVAAWIADPTRRTLPSGADRDGRIELAHLAWSHGQDGR